MKNIKYFWIVIHQIIIVFIVLEIYSSLSKYSSNRVFEVIVSSLLILIYCEIITRFSMLGTFNSLLNYALDKEFIEMKELIKPSPVIDLELEVEQNSVRDKEIKENLNKNIILLVSYSFIYLIVLYNLFSVIFFN